MRILAALGFILLSLVGYGQEATEEKVRDVSLIYVKGLRGVGVSANLNQYGKNIEFRYMEFIMNDGYFNINLLLEDGIVGKTEYNYYYLRPMFYYSFYNLSNTVFLNGSIGLFGGMELVKNEGFKAKEQALTYGGSIGGEIDIRVVKNFFINLEFQQLYTRNSMLGDLHAQYGLGVKLMFE